MLLHTKASYAVLSTKTPEQDAIGCRSEGASVVWKLPYRAQQSHIHREEQMLLRYCAGHHTSIKCLGTSWCFCLVFAYKLLHCTLLSCLQLLGGGGRNSIKRSEYDCWEFHAQRWLLGAGFHLALFCLHCHLRAGRKRNVAREVGEWGFYIWIFHCVVHSWWVAAAYARIVALLSGN